MPTDFGQVPWKHHIYIFTHCKFMPEFVGKLNFYVSAVDELLRQEDDNPSIGLLICKSKDNTMVEWSFRGITQTLGVAEYKLDKRLNDILPSEKDLQRIIDTYYSEEKSLQP